MRRLTLLMLCALALGATAQAQEPFPLDGDDSWTYIYVLDPPFAPPDTTRFTVSVTERLTLRDTAYVVVAFPAMPSDTLRTTGDGQVWGRVADRDVLLLDLTQEDGATYTVAGLGGSGAQLVTVMRPYRVDFPAGRFENAIHFLFDDPAWFDDEFSVVVVPGVGVVAGYALYGSTGILESATIGGRQYTPLEDAPLADAVGVRPNPFSASTTLDLPAGPWLRAEVYDVLGRRVALLDLDGCGAEPCAVRWTARGQAPGRYVVRVDGERQSLAVPVTVAR